MKKNPLLSIIIPTYNEERDIKKCLESLLNQNYKNFEIIVVDDGSKDRTLNIVRRIKKIRILRQSHNGPGAARNLGARKCHGKILIFVDADMIFDKDYLKFLIKPIIEEGVIGTEEELQYSTNLDNIWSKCWGKIRTNPESKERKIFRAIKKSEFFKLGGFDSKYGYADDQTFFLKYGITAKPAKGAICFHDNPKTLKEVYDQSKWISSSSKKRFLYSQIICLISLLFYILFSPLSIIFLSIKKCYKNQNFKLLFPWMIIFITIRYFGMIHGMIRKAFSMRSIR